MQEDVHQETNATTKTKKNHSINNFRASFQPTSILNRQIYDLKEDHEKNRLKLKTPLISKDLYLPLHEGQVSS
jgi:SUMO ligase MMS21 Smc5/6 complex component